jgi:hypothetical protein
MFKCIVAFLFFFTPLIAQTEAEKQTRALEEHGSSVISQQSELTEFWRDSTSTWNPLTSATTGFGRAIMGAIGDYVYVFTGQGTTSLAIAYHIPTNTWINSTECTAPSYNSGFVVANGELYKLSGTTSASVFEKFTPAGNGTGTWTVLTAGPSSIMNAQNSLVWDRNNSIYVYSGSYTSPYPSFMVRYDIAAGTWENKTGSIHTRRYAGMAAAGKYIYLIGGLIADATSGAICQRYDTATDTWALIAPLPEEINFSKWSVTSDGKYIFLLGSGGGYSSYPASPNAYYYNPDTDTWALETPLPAPRGLVHGTYIPGHNKLLWGGGNNTISSTAFQPHIWEGVNGVYVPVEMVSFTADVTLRGAELKWTTASEKNNSHFVVEKSSDGILFDEISIVTGSGTKLNESNYSYTDQTYSGGVCFYRLRQVDYDGSYSYSDVVNVESEIPSMFVLEQNYPNPFNPSTRIRYQLPVDGLVTLQLYDPVGRLVGVLVNEEKPAGTHEVMFNASSYSSGVYYYKLTSGQNSGIKKLLLMK